MASSPQRIHRGWHGSYITYKSKRSLQRMQVKSSALVQIQVSTTVKQILHHPLCCIPLLMCPHTETRPALGDPTSTKGFHSNAKLLYLSMIVVDILGLEHTLIERFIKIKRIREALSDHITNISSVNAAHSHLAFSTTLRHVFWKYQHQLCINSTSTCNFLKEKRVKAYLNPWWHEQSLSPNFKLQEAHGQCKILHKSIEKLSQLSQALWKNKWKNPSSLLILLLPSNSIYSKALRWRLTGLFDTTEVLPNWDAQVLQ